MDPGLIELFVDGKEDSLPDSGRLDELGLGEGSVVFMLFREGWRWEKCGREITLSSGGLAANKTEGTWNLVTGGPLMTEGRHYWEVELTAGHMVTVGACRPGRDHCETHHYGGNEALFADGYSGGLYGNGKCGHDKQGQFATGDRIGVLLDLDAGWMRFYRNGKRCGPGFTKDVTGPMVRAAQLLKEGCITKALPSAEAPEGAGAADEPWEDAGIPEREICF